MCVAYYVAFQGSVLKRYVWLGGDVRDGGVNGNGNETPPCKWINPISVLNYRALQRNQKLACGNSVCFWHLQLQDMCKLIRHDFMLCRFSNNNRWSFMFIVWEKAVYSNVSKLFASRVPLVILLPKTKYSRAVIKLKRLSFKYFFNNYIYIYILLQ
jgi:hypothetical protein